MKTKFTFGPSREIRGFKCETLKGQIVQLELGHYPFERLSPELKELPRAKATNQYVSVQGPKIGGYPLSLGYWCGRVLGDKGEKLELKILDAYLLEGFNGGRAVADHYDSYRAYFSAERKEELFRLWRGVFEAKLTRGCGDPDRADLGLMLKYNSTTLALSGHLYELAYPQEWYSECFAKHPTLAFKDGFYESADAAVEDFKSNKVDDFFGTRYFPVAVLPKNTKADDVSSFKNSPKGSSGVVMTKYGLAIGTRCKPYEVADVIACAYGLGGKIGKNVQWDW